MERPWQLLGERTAPVWLLDHIADALFVIDSEGRITDVNQQACDSLGYSREELLTLSLHDIEVRHSGRELPQFFERLAPGERLTDEGVQRRKDGTTFPVEVRVTSFLSEDRRFLVALARDVTERKRAEENLKQLKEFYEKILNGLPAEIAVFDHEERYLFVNAAGIADPEIRRWIIGKTDLDYCQRRGVDPAMARERQKWQRRAIAEGRELGFEEDIVTWRGERRQFTRRFIPYPGPQGETSVLIAYGEDITERRRLEEQLHQSQKMEAVGRLAGGVAHDFNNLLTVIGGYAELLDMEVAEGDPLREAADGILRSSERAMALTRQLLAFSRKQVLQPKVLDLNAAVTEMDRLLRRVIGEDVELLTVLQPGVGRIRVDPGQLEQVIMNLVVNARDAMPEGGRLTLRTSALEVEGPTKFDVDPGSYVLLEVSDTGCGMDREVLSHIFEPFFTTKERGKGTGLGLAIVYGVVKQSGGTVEATSQVGQGTTFRILLPRVSPEAEEGTEDEGWAEAAGGSETVLLVEDEDEVRRLAASILEAHGYTVLTAGHGVEALALVRGHSGPIHLLVTDVVMPQMGGPELAARLAQVRPETRVLYISGYSDDAVVDQSLVAPLVEKPFKRQVLVRKVREVLDGAAARGAEHPQEVPLEEKGRGS